MIVLGLVLAALAAALHVYIFVLESVLWTTSRARSTFGTTAGEAEATKEMAYNQGFYNLFLALGAGLGLILYFVGNVPAGLTLVLFTTACMVLASIIIASTGKKYLVPALIQGVPPLLGLVFFAAAS